MSLAPSSTITASVPSGTDQSSRASPSDGGIAGDAGIVDFGIDALAATAACRRGTKPSLAGRPKPAVSESPSATIWSGRLGPGAAGTPRPLFRPRAPRYKPPTIWRDGAGATHMSRRADVCGSTDSGRLEA